MGPLSVPSNLMVEQEVTVTTRVSGVIDSIQAERGELVKKGQPLATLDQREFRLDLKAAEETLSVSQADLKRYEELRRLNLTSEAEFEQRRSRHELALVELERAKLVIDRSIVRAPFDGIVADRYARVGEKFLLEESKPLFKVTALEPLLARAYLPASSLQTLRTGDEVSVDAPDFPDARSGGRVSFISPVIDPGSGTVQVIVRVRSDPKKVLRPGMAVRLTFRPPSRP
ncbi:MAG: efflux RND transporter periplasmic adaptor subunit [Thermoanaerobaculia bacterium]